MILKKYKSRILIYLVIIVMIMTFITLDKKLFTLSFHDTLEYVMSADPGFSYPRNLIDTGDNYLLSESVSQKIKAIIRNFHKIIFYSWQDHNNELDHININDIIFFLLD